MTEEAKAKETVTCPFCQTPDVEVVDLGSNYQYQKRKGFKCPKCGAVSVQGSSEWTGENIPFGIFPVFRPWFDPFETVRFPSLFSDWPFPDPFTHLTRSLFQEANALLRSAEKPAQVEENKTDK